MAHYTQKIEISNDSGTTWTDITSYLAAGGLKYSRNDVEASNSGRTTMDGTMHRSRVSIKVRLDCTCRLLTDEEAKTLLTLILPEWVMVKYYNPQAGSYTTMTAYSNNIPATYNMVKDGVSYWGDIAFPLIER